MRSKKYSLMKILSPKIKKSKKSYRLHRKLYGIPPFDVRDRIIVIDLSEPKLKKIYKNLKLYNKLESLRAGDIGPIVIRKRKSKMVFDEFNTYNPVRGIEYTGIILNWYKKHNRKMSIYILND